MRRRHGGRRRARSRAPWQPRAALVQPAAAVPPLPGSPAPPLCIRRPGKEAGICVYLAAGDHGLAATILHLCNSPLRPLQGSPIQDDVELAPQAKPPNREIASAERCAADVSGALQCDSLEEVPTSNLGRLRKRTAASVAATAEVPDVRLRDDEDDVESAPQAKPLKKEITSAERYAADVSESRQCDSHEEDSTRNLRRLRKRTAASVAATAEVPDVKLSDDKGVCMEES